MKVRLESLGVALLLLASSRAAADEPKIAAPRLEFGEYLRRVLAANPDLQAVRASIDIAKAQIDVAKAFPDPELTVGVSQYDITRRGNPTMAGPQLSVPIELGGKRRSRVAVAQSALGAAGCDYEDATRTLRGLAADAFVDALFAHLVVAQKESALAHLRRLVSVNERRLAAGDIAQVDFLQSRVEAQQYQADVMAAQGELHSAEAAMAQLLGPEAEPTFDLVGELKSAPATLDVPKLFAALDKRPDVRASAMRVQGAEQQIVSEEAKRVVDISLGAGWQHSFAAGGDEGGGARPADLVSASVSVPLPFSRIYKGELEAARHTHRQTQSQWQATRARARGELRKALALFEAASARVALYDKGTLSDSLSVLEKILYSYEHGDATLVEVLIAQRTASEVHLAYLDALADRAHALIAVSQAAGSKEDLFNL
jgi:cobalt-zinc-cadmium efflux system outer membrane protein